MATQFSFLQIINAALVAQGQYTVDENDGSDEWSLLSRNWPQIVESELEVGAYNFTREQTALATRIDGRFGYDDGYALPLDALHVRQVWIEDNGRRFVDWTQDGATVYLNNDDGCVIEYVSVTTEDLWNANFCLGVQCKLEAVILRALKEEAREADAREAAAEMYFDRARVKSSRSRSATPPYREGRFARARFGRG